MKTAASTPPPFLARYCTGMAFSKKYFGMGCGQNITAGRKIPPLSSPDQCCGYHEIISGQKSLYLFEKTGIKREFISQKQRGRSSLNARVSTPSLPLQTKRRQSICRRIRVSQSPASQDRIRQTAADNTGLHLFTHPTPPLFFFRVLTTLDPRKSVRLRAGGMMIPEISQSSSD